MRTGGREDAEPAGRILVVEDQADVQLMLTAALELEGYSVTAAASAIEGLQCLRSARFDLVLTDYSMPGGTGAWMLHEANREGLLAGTAALIVTAQPDIVRIAGVEVVAKPLDLEVFLDQVRRITGRQPSERTPSVPSPTVEFVLYISGSSAASQRARRLMETIRGECGGQFNLTICDLEDDPLCGNADRIVFTPTLVKRSPGPPVWVVGDLREPGLVHDLLRACGVGSPGISGDSVATAGVLHHPPRTMDRNASILDR